MVEYNIEDDFDIELPSRTKEGLKRLLVAKLQVQTFEVPRPVPMISVRARTTTVLGNMAVFGDR